MKKDKHIGNSKSGDKKRSLSDIPKHPSFVVPDGYFEKLPLKIQERLSSSKDSWWKELAAYLFKPGIAIQAFLMILVISVGTYYFLRPTSEDHGVAVTKEKMEDLKEEKIIKEIELVRKEEVAAKHVEEIEEQMIVEQIEEDTVSENAVHQEDPIAATSSEEIEYLIENDIDVSFIIDELQRN